MKEHLAKLPSVNILLQNLNDEKFDIHSRYLKTLIVDIVQQIKDNPHLFHLHTKTRVEIQNDIILRTRNTIHDLLEPSLKRVINGTGIVLHTGLGRAPLGENDFAELRNIYFYSNLEINLSTGRRGDRLHHIAPHLRLLTGAEDAIAVNNNAAAVLLTLHSLARRKEVIISRGELVEIGGSFRMPEVMQNSQARMVEVGATNITHLEDYISAINEKTGAIMLVHPSNFEIVGFTAKPELTEIVNRAHEYSIPVIYDLGSGAIEDMRHFNLGPEPIVRDVLETGVDVVTFSGDKLLGGPQAGIIVGNSACLKIIKRNHLLRALRCDKVTLALLNIVLRKYLRKEPLSNSITTLKLFSRSKKEMNRLAANLIKQLHPPLKERAVIIDADGKVGSGAFPVLRIPALALHISHPRYHANRIALKLRQNPVPITGIIDQDKFLLNFLTIFEHDIPVLANALNSLK